MGPGATDTARLSDPEKIRETRRLAQRRVRHFLADFRDLESRYPGAYPRLITRGEGRVPVRRLRAPAARRRQPPRGRDDRPRAPRGRRAHGRAGGDARVRRARLGRFAPQGGRARRASRRARADGRSDLLVHVERDASPTTSPSRSRARTTRAVESRERTLILSRDGSYHGSSYSRDGSHRRAGVPRRTSGRCPTASSRCRSRRPGAARSASGPKAARSAARMRSRRRSSTRARRTSPRSSPSRWRSCKR